MLIARRDTHAREEIAFVLEVGILARRLVQLAERHTSCSTQGVGRSEIAVTPRLWVFNPGHEEALSFSREKRYTLSKEIRWMRYELSPLLRLLASGEDRIQPVGHRPQHSAGVLVFLRAKQVHR